MKLLLALLLTAQLFASGRTFVVETPEHYRHPALIIVLHGHGGSGAEVIGMIGPQRNTIVVAPDGQGHSWNACHCCGYAYDNQVDDVGFIAALIEQMVQTYGVDRNKVFVVGFSNGGMMAHKLAGALSDKIAAFADISGTIGGRAGDGLQVTVPDRPRDEVSIIMVHGMLDQVVKFNQDWSLPADRYDISFAQGVEFWREACGYSVKVRSSATDDYEINQYMPHYRAPLELLSIAFTTGGHDCQNWEFVKDKILLFFERHPKFKGGKPWES